jgi:hypothetical protein
MLIDPHSKQISLSPDKNNYTEDEFHETLKLLIDNNNTTNIKTKKRKQTEPEYWTDSDNDDWPKYDHKNEYPYDPTIKVPAEQRQRNVINLEETAKKTNKQQRQSKRVKLVGNVPVTPMERLNYAIAFKKSKPRAHSIGGRKTKRKTKDKTKSKTKRNKGGSGNKSTNKRTNKRTNKDTNKLYITKDGMYLLPGTRKLNHYVVEVEDPNAEEGSLNNMAKIRGPNPTPVYNPNTGVFK